MRPAAEVEPVALRIELDLFAFGNRVDQLDLEGLALLLEQLLRLLAIYYLASERPIASHDLAHLRFDLGQILGRERLVACEVVIEAILDDWADGDLRTGVELLHRLSHHMRCIVADERQRLGIFARQDADLGI